MFLDIEMPDTNGFQLAKQIHMINPEADIIFVSAHESLVLEIGRDRRKALLQAMRQYK